jgi:hypothetical protein
MQAAAFAGPGGAPPGRERAGAGRDPAAPSDPDQPGRAAS